MIAIPVTVLLALVLAALVFERGRFTVIIAVLSVVIGLLLAQTAVGRFMSDVLHTFGL
jgi:hypothetical protein